MPIVDGGVPSKFTFEQDCRLHFVSPTSQKGGVPKAPAPPAALLGVFHFRAFKSKLLTPSNRKPRYYVPGSLCPEQESNLHYLAITRF